MSLIFEMLNERLSGPSCPVCTRTDGGHALGCPVPDYIIGWKRVYDEQARRVAGELFRDPLREYEVRLEYPDGSKRTVRVYAKHAEDAEWRAVQGEPDGVIPHAFEASADG